MTLGLDIAGHPRTSRPTSRVTVSSNPVPRVAYANLLHRKHMPPDTLALRSDNLNQQIGTLATQDHWDSYRRTRNRDHLLAGHLHLPKSARSPSLSLRPNPPNRLRQLPRPTVDVLRQPRPTPPPRQHSQQGSTPETSSPGLPLCDETYANLNGDRPHPPRHPFGLKPSAGLFATRRRRSISSRRQNVRRMQASSHLSQSSQRR